MEGEGEGEGEGEVSKWNLEVYKEFERTHHAVSQQKDELSW